MKFSEVTILQDVEFPIFLLIFAWALQKCSLLPVIINFSVQLHCAHISIHIRFVNVVVLQYVLNRCKTTKNISLTSS